MVNDFTIKTYRKANVLRERERVGERDFKMGIGFNLFNNKLEMFILVYIDSRERLREKKERERELLTHKSLSNLCVWNCFVIIEIINYSVHF